ncbi:MAG: hypothetical protein OEZ48_09345 [Candidatus Bathyarchaeota archaeon]|nr:hypothetical protein [Candidatus Bathyarchaeota archaeon]
MQEIGKFTYPERGTFQDALKVAKKALQDYGGVIPNEKAAEELGYKIKDRSSMSGFIYKRFDDFCMFGLTKRERGVIRTTDLAVKALDPTDTEKATEGKAEAVRKVHIIAKAYDDWNGEMPSDTAFPARIGQITSVSWIEAQKHAESLRKLFNETFPYLKAAPEPTVESAPIGDEERGDIVSRQEVGWMSVTARGKGFGFTKTLPFTGEGMKSLKKLIEFLETQVEQEGAEDSTEREQQTTETD